MSDKDIILEIQKKNRDIDMCCNAILLNFKENIIYDYPIPDVSKVTDAIKMALNDSKNTSKRILDLISEYIEERHDEDSYLRRYLWSQNVFGHEFFYGSGELFRFRDTKGIKKKVLEHFNKKELEEINKIGKIAVQHVKTEK